jgi:uncharacterized protein YqgC (DUF456 family)
MALDIVISVVAGILLAVAAFGTVFPVLPGSPIAFAALIAWGWVLGGAAAWTAAIIGALLCALGFLATALLTSRKLKQQRIPKRSTLIAVVAGIVGMFVVPVVGLFVGFAGGLFLSEYVRLGESRAALRASGEALKAIGLGMLVEFTMVALASSIWMIGLIVHFATL